MKVSSSREASNDAQEIPPTRHPLLHLHRPHLYLRLALSFPRNPVKLANFSVSCLALDNEIMFNGRQKQRDEPAGILYNLDNNSIAMFWM